MNRNSFGLVASWMFGFGFFETFLLRVIYLLNFYLHQNPGFDFSGAEISGNYSKGGPDFSSLGK